MIQFNIYRYKSTYLKHQPLLLLSPLCLHHLHFLFPFPICLNKQLVTRDKTIMNLELNAQ